MSSVHPVLLMHIKYVKKQETKLFYTRVSKTDDVKSSFDELELIPDSLDEHESCLIVAVCTQTG
jgi:hypothetical protein